MFSVFVQTVALFAFQETVFSETLYEDSYQLRYRVCVCYIYDGHTTLYILLYPKKRSEVDIFQRQMWKSSSLCRCPRGYQYHRGPLPAMFTHSDSMGSQSLAQEKDWRSFRFHGWNHVSLFYPERFRRLQYRSGVALGIIGLYYRILIFGPDPFWSLSSVYAVL